MTSASQIRVTSLSIVFSPSEPSLYTYSLALTIFLKSLKIVSVDESETLDKMEMFNKNLEEQ